MGNLFSFFHLGLVSDIKILLYFASPIQCLDLIQCRSVSGERIRSFLKNRVFLRVIFKYMDGHMSCIPSTQYLDTFETSQTGCTGYLFLNAYF